MLVKISVVLRGRKKRIWNNIYIRLKQRKSEYSQPLFLFHPLHNMAFTQDYETVTPLSIHFGDYSVGKKKRR